MGAEGGGVEVWLGMWLEVWLGKACEYLGCRWV